MPTYVTLISWTDQGTRQVKDTVKRYEAAQAMAGKLGVRFKEFLWTMGAYDAVGIVEAASDEAVSQFVLAVGSLGNVRTLTMRAYSTEEMGRILAGMP